MKKEDPSAHMSKFFNQPGKLKELKGSALLPENAGLRLVVNLCSTKGNWNTELNKMISKKWARVKEEYRTWFVMVTGFKPGKIQSVLVQSDVWVVNCLCLNDKDELDEKAFADCLVELAKFAKDNKAAGVHVSGIEQLHHKEDVKIVYNPLLNSGVNVYIYKE